MKLSELTDEQKASMKVKHYTLHIPATASDEQIMFIQNMARSVLDNEPFTVIHEKALQFLLRLGIAYRNVLAEFDEFENRWSAEDHKFLESILKDFSPMLDYLQEQLNIDVNKYKDKLRK